ncbi:unnamed protein product [Arctogadus glacialis]
MWGEQVGSLQRTPGCQLHDGMATEPTSVSSCQRLSVSKGLRGTSHPALPNRQVSTLALVSSEQATPTALYSRHPPIPTLTPPRPPPIRTNDRRAQIKARDAAASLAKANDLQLPSSHGLLGVACSLWRGRVHSAPAV